MLLSKLLWFLAVSGVSVRALELIAAEDTVSVNAGQSAYLHWILRISKGETYRILWARITVDAAGTHILKDVMFNKTEKQASATPRYPNRVKILPPASLFIQWVRLPDEGFYMCEITTALRRIREAIYLNVIDPPADWLIRGWSEPPFIIRFPEDQIVHENGQVSVRCGAVGYPPPKITWIKLLGNQKVREEKYMYIEDVQQSDQGRYRCVASNGVGQDATAEFKINVYCYGSEHTTCKSSSDPLTRTILFIVLGLLAGLITMAVLIKFWIGRRHKPPASLRLPPDIDENDFKFDVFVTYSRKDYPWVDEELLCLLRENQVKYCVDHEHFELGKVFVQAMVDSVYQSRKVLAVWSENYASSKYCKQELDYAIQRSFKNNDCSVIVIRLDKTDPKRLPKPLRAKTFLDYSDSVERKGWKRRLIRHLKGPDHTNNAKATIV